MTTNIKRICLISHTMHMGGMERVMAGLANYYARKTELDVSLVLLLNVERFYSLNQNIKIIEPGFLLKEMPRWKYTIKTLLWLRKTIKKIDPDTILSFGEYWNSFVLLASLGLSYPKFISDRSNPTDKVPLYNIHELLRRVLYRTATGLIAQSQIARDILISKTGLKNCLVAGNPIRMISDNGSQRDNIIISVGRLIPLKQTGKLIEFFAKLKDDSWKLQIIGDGPLYDELVNSATELDINDRVEFLGSIKNVDDFLLKAKIYAFTSNYEGFPNALAEGMSAGLAPISFDCPVGPSDLITDGENGFLIPLNDEELFIKRLQELTTDDILIEKFSVEARKTILNRYEESKVSESILDFILMRST